MPTISNELASFEIVGFVFFRLRGSEGDEMAGKSSATRPKSVRAKMQVPEVDLGFRWGLPNTLLLAIGVGVLVAGYVTLGRGSTTMAPVFLVTGYCVLIPASLLVRGGGSTEGE